MLDKQKKCSTDTVQQWLRILAVMILQYSLKMDWYESTVKEVNFEKGKLHTKSMKFDVDAL